MKDVMLDFEALGNSQDPCLCQVGAIYFDSSTGEVGRALKLNIDAGTHGPLDAKTVYWWLEQSKEAQMSILAQPRLSVREAMEQLNDFLADATRIWGHATYDLVMLTNTLRKLGIVPKFKFNAGLDLRTLVYLAGTSVGKIERTGLHHDALEDCKHQVKYAVAALNIVKTNKKAINLLEKLTGDA